MRKFTVVQIDIPPIPPDLIGPDAAPTLLIATMYSDTQINLVWQDNSTNEEGFSIERSTGGSYAAIGVVGTDVESYSDSGLDPITLYSYRIRALRGALYSDYSNIDDATTDETLDGVPSLLTATVIADIRIDLVWTNGSTNENGISIERSTNGVNYVEIDTVTSAVAVYSDITCDPETLYYYRVRAFRTPQYSDYSNVDSKTTDKAVILEYSSRSGLDFLETASGSSYNAKILPVCATFAAGAASNIVIPDVTGLNAVTAFSIYMIINSTADNSTQLLFLRTGGTTTWLQIYISNTNIGVDVCGNSAATSRYIFSARHTKNIKQEILITYDNTRSTNKVHLTVNGIEYNPSTLPSTSEPTATGNFSGTTTIGFTSVSLTGTMSTFGIWASNISLANARIAASIPIRYYAEVFSGIDVSGFGGDATTFNTITKGYSALSSWLLDYGYTYYTDGGVNFLNLPYNASGNPVYTDATYVRSAITYNKGAEFPGRLTAINCADAKIDFDPTISTADILYAFNRKDTLVCTATARLGYYSATYPHQWHITELNRETMTAFYNVPHLFNIFPVFNGNSVDDRDYMTEVLVHELNILTSAKVTYRLTYTGDIGKVTIPPVLMGYESSQTEYLENAIFDYIVDTFHVDYTRGDKQFAAMNNAVFYSEDGGVTWSTVKAMPNCGKITMSYIWGNGNIQFAYMNKMYLSTDNLATVILKTVYESDGVTPINTSYTGGIFANVIPTRPIIVGATEILSWINYCNVTLNCEINQFYSVDNGITTKVGYKWGQNAAYGGFGDPLNANICRHGHQIEHRDSDNTWWMITGDGIAGRIECHVAKGTYNPGTDVWSWTILQSGDLNSWYKWGGIMFSGTNLLWVSDSSDATKWGAFKVPEADLGDSGEFVEISSAGFNSTGGPLFTSATEVIGSNLETAKGVLYSTNILTTWGKTTLTNLGAGIVVWRFTPKNTAGYYRADLSSVTFDAGFNGSIVWIKFK